jgi:hypothetical protein
VSGSAVVHSSHAAEPQVRLLKIERRLPRAGPVPLAQADVPCEESPECRDFQQRANLLLRGLADAIRPTGHVGREAASTHEVLIRAHVDGLESFFRGQPPFGCVKRMMRCG